MKGDIIMLERYEAFEVTQIQHNKAQRFKKECELIDRIREAKPLRTIFLSDYNCTVKELPTWGMSEQRYAVYKGCAYDDSGYDREFEYLDDLAEYIVANY